MMHLTAQQIMNLEVVPEKKLLADSKFVKQIFCY